MRYTVIPAIVAFLAFAACGSGQSTIDPAKHASEIREWREGRLERLKGPNGYLNLAGLFWLKPGTVSFGSSPDNDLQFPASAPPLIGELTLTRDGVTMRVEPGVAAYWDETPVESMLLNDDTSESPVLIRLGTLAWMVIKRADRYALRLRDMAHPAIEAFPPIEYFPIDTSLRVEGTLSPYDEPRKLNVETVIEGLGYHPQSPGSVSFDVDGKTYDLEAYESGDRLFFVFGDGTSGKETYPAGRFLYAAAPDENGKTILDFNRSYNPPCAFNAFSTCPVASPRNRLKVRIEAGEKYDPKVHALPGAAH